MSISPSDFNAKIIEEFRTNKGRVGGRFEGLPILLLHHTGARSGEQGAERRAQLAAARLYLVCPTGPAAGEGSFEEHTRALPDLIRAAVAGGVDILQLREKHLPDDELVAVAKALQALCERIGAL